ncbi:hypothetical protein MRX96_057617 [Rhipicephalus microplus]
MWAGAGSLEAAATFLSWLALARPTWAPVCLAERASCLKRDFIRIPLSVGGNPAVEVGFLFGDLLFFYHSLMRHGLFGGWPNKRLSVPPFRAAAPDAVYKHK